MMQVTERSYRTSTTTIFSEPRCYRCVDPTSASSALSESLSQTEVEKPKADYVAGNAWPILDTFSESCSGCEKSYGDIYPDRQLSR